MILKLKDGDVKIELFKDVAPNHVERIKKLADDGNYDGVVFHRVIDGFMAQTGDVKFGNTNNNDFDFYQNSLTFTLALYPFLSYLDIYHQFLHELCLLLLLQ